MNCFERRGINLPNDLMNYFDKNMKYGFRYFNKTYSDLETDFQEKMNKFYKIRLGEDFLRSGYGVCWDFCELERLFFEKKGILHECYFVESILENGNGGPTHTFALFEQNGKWFWFEFAWFYHRGIHQYSSKIDAIKDVYQNFVNFYDLNFKEINIYKTQKVIKRLNAFEFVDLCLSGECIFKD